MLLAPKEADYDGPCNSKRKSGVIVSTAAKQSHTPLIFPLPLPLQAVMLPPRSQWRSMLLSVTCTEQKPTALNSYPCDSTQMS